MATSAKPEKLKIQFPLGEAVIDGAVIKALSYQAFAEVIAEAQSMKAPKTLEGRMRRIRMARQVSYYVNGTVVPVTQDDVLQMPIPTARIITAKLDDFEGVAGKITRDGDGIDKSIVYELGTPIPVGGGKDPIKELEFHAKTYGEVEDVMAQPDIIQQTQMLIATIAKPLGTTLLQLPSWALGQITIADGVTISRLVTPRFFGLADE